ncbi:response regulator transcription factor [Marinimicrobium sp. ARAG 43.8]|uniref:response regulator transcription factor n=1 Tax=Marinimicrobium sp. ARAG 43.8 TaxID=3418719 RepID=UPI003CF08664
MTAIPRILVVEDNPDLRIEIVDYLTFCHYTVASADGIEQMHEALANGYWNILLLDLTLADGDGLTAARMLRELYGLKMGIIMVTARGQVEDRIQGISAGADAYLVKPINLTELKVTIDHLSLRLQEPTASATALSWKVDEQSLELICPNTERVSLTVTESLLLKKLLEKRGDPVTRDTLCECLPPGRLDDTRRLDSILSRLRSKTKKEAGVNLPVHTLRNKGYSFAIDSQ